MRIAIISRALPPNGGGIGSWSRKASIGLARLGHHVHLFTAARDEPPGTEIGGGVTMCTLHPARARPNSLGWAWAAARAVRSQGAFDVVQACEWDAEGFVHSIVSRTPLVTRLATPHYIVQRTNRAARIQVARSLVTRWMEREQARRSAAVISPSQALAVDVAATWRIDPGAIEIVPTGVDPPDCSNGSLPGHLYGVPYVLYFGRMEARKGVDVWIDALPTVLNSHPEVRAVLVGEDLGWRGRPFADHLRERCAGLLDRVDLIPHLAPGDLFPIVAAASLVVLPSRWENLANACLEAMALGRPVLATRGSGFEELITDSVDGWLVAPGDSGALARVACAALDDRVTLDRVGEAGRRRAAELTVDAMARRLVTVYESVIG